MNSLVNRLKDGKVLVSDGAWGTFLHNRGLKPGECPELWNVTHRDDVLAIAQSYIDAGANMILTNSFGGSPIKLDHFGLKDRAYELNQVAAEISRQAAGDDHFVLGDIGPTGAMLMMGQVSEQEMYDGFRIQSEALQKGGSDAICIETMAAIDEGVLAVRAAKESTDLEVICSFTFEKTSQGDFRTMMGVSPFEMVKAIKDAGADIIGTNCGNGFEQMIPIVKEIRKADAEMPILVHANAGVPLVQEGETIFPETPELMASRVQELINCGANIIGGCCGTTPDHIKALAKEIKKY
ncbi:MAG: homocysteine S-methyltransferase family protein [Calditrichaceae bacterium]